MITSRTDAASFIPYRDLPRADYELVARYTGPLDDILKRNGIRAQRRNAKSEGGPSRALAVSLRSGRHAQVLEYDHSPDDIEIYLEVVDELCVYKSDLSAVSGLIGVSVKDFSWIAGDSIVRWR